MNFSQCANCLLHGWTEVEDSTRLQQCKRCKLIKYCGRECQTEHWLKVHHNHCKYFADTVMAQQWDHKEANCIICRQAALVGKAQLVCTDNPNYECIFEEMKNGGLLHPHPFLATGDPSDTYEKAIIVLLQLLQKFQLTHPEVINNCRDDFREVVSYVMGFRLRIWIDRKISPKPQLHKLRNIPLDLSPIGDQIKRSQPIQDPFQLWKMIQLVGKMLYDVDMSRKFNSLINPLASVPAELHAVVSEGVSNSVKFLVKANQVLDALATQLIPYRDVFSIIYGASGETVCSICSKQITIDDVASDSSGVPLAVFGCMHAPMLCCTRPSCIRTANSWREDLSRSVATLIASVMEREITRCDFCLKLPASKDVHRCSKCLTVMYCSTQCRDQDWDIHKKVCKEDVEGRKKKCGRLGRRKEAMDALDYMEKSFQQVNVRDASEFVGKFKREISKKCKK